MGRGEVKGELLDDLWRRLNQPSNLGRRPMRNEARRVGEMAREGWVLRCDVEDLLADHDERTWGLDAFDLARAFGLAPDLVWTVHSRRQTSFVGSDRLAAADVAALLIRVERLGFEVDPTAMADAVCPTLEGRRLLTDGELTVLNWAKERHKTADIRLQRAASDARWTGRTAAIRTGTGYRATAFLLEGGALHSLEVRAPRFRKQREAVATECPDCGMTYMKGDAEDGASHRAHHRKVVRTMMPTHNRRFAAAAVGGRPVAVDGASPHWLRSQVYERARLFRKEFGYDFVQWSVKDEDPATTIGFLFPGAGSDEDAMAGACCFRRRGEGDAAAWWLDWIWMAPPYRRRGILSRHWPWFLERFGLFHLGHPLSGAMLAFAGSVGHPDAE